MTLKSIKRSNLSVSKPTCKYEVDVTTETITTFQNCLRGTILTGQYHLLLRYSQYHHLLFFSFTPHVDPTGSAKTAMQKISCASINLFFLPSCPLFNFVFFYCTSQRLSLVPKAVYILCFLSLVYIIIKSQFDYTYFYFLFIFSAFLNCVPYS